MGMGVGKGKVIDPFLSLRYWPHRKGGAVPVPLPAPLAFAGNTRPDDPVDMNVGLRLVGVGEDHNVPVSAKVRRGKGKARQSEAKDNVLGALETIGSWLWWLSDDGLWHMGLGLGLQCG